MATSTDDGAAPMMSAELLAELGGDGGALMMTSARKKSAAGCGGKKKPPPPAPAKKLSKSQKRKIAKLEEDRRKRGERASVMKRLEAAKLVSDASLALLHGSAAMGQRRTARENLRRELKAERAGIRLPGTEDSRLHKREKPPVGEDGGGGEDDDGGDGDGDESESDGDAAEEEDPMLEEKQKASWPRVGGTISGLKKIPKTTAGLASDEYGPIHPMDTKRLSDAAALAAAEAAVMAANETRDDDVEESVDAAAARARTAAAMKTARALSDLVRARDPEQAAERATEALGPMAAAAALDPKDAAAQLAAANEAARRAADARFPNAFRGASFSVPVRRDAKIQEAREGLPILGAEHDIVDAINHHPITVICGETGCGKTTQVPQFLYEAGYGDEDCLDHPGAVAVTQPRRVAVTSTATRVAKELSVKLGGEVGYQVRYDKRVGASPRIKFMTDGVLLREIKSDLLLRKYSVVIVDEAHERSVNTDILLGLLSRVVPLRAELAMEGRPGITPLRLVVMSATLRVEEFVGNKKLCPTPPALLKIAARQYPVTVHFARVTEHGYYLNAAKKKTLAIHKKLPPGGILVFVTGQREVEGLCDKLRKAFPKKEKKGAGEAATAGREATPPPDDDDDGDGDGDGDGAALDAYDVDGVDRGGESESESDDDDDDDRGGEDANGDDAFDGRDDFDDAIDDDSASDVSEDEDARVVHGGEGVTPEEAAAAEDAWTRAHAPTSDAPGSRSRAEDDGEDDGPGYLHVLPLYALLPPTLQKRVFDPPPRGARLVIVSTNVAETSLTIPGVRYVVDAGREKRRVYGDDAAGVGDGAGAASASAGLSKFEVGWVSKASAEQRAGRAGRTGPGHCYRLFSSAHFVNELPPHAPPAILGVPVEGVVLQMRAMGIDRVGRFPFISPPSPAALDAARKTLAILGALAPAAGAENRKYGHFGSFGADDDVGVLTEVGRAMAALPISPRHARMLLAALGASPSGGCLAAAVATAAALSVDSPFLRSDAKQSDATDGDAPADDEERKRRRKLAHKFHHPNSDALSAARALVAFDAAGGVDDPRAAEKFCVEHRLHGKTMREMSDLRRQLLRILSKPPPSVAMHATAGIESLLTPGAKRAIAEASAAVNKPPRGEKRRKDPAASSLEIGAPGETSLRRALLIGWADRVARRSKPSDVREKYDENDNTKATRYKPAMLDQNVFLHPSSTLHRSAPDYVVYVDLMQTAKRPYVIGATVVDAAWLVDDAAALTSLSSPLEEPAPRYVRARDAVVAFAQPSHGRHRWELPLHAVPLTAERGGCGAFAAALLSGAVSAPMAEFRDKLAAKPSLCARPEGKSQRRVIELIHALRRRNVASRAALIEVWRREPRYLMPEVRDWMKSGMGHAIERAWPRIVSGDAPAPSSSNADDDASRGRSRVPSASVAGGTEARAALKAKRREAEKRAGGGGTGGGKKRKTVVNRKALGGGPGLSIWD